MQRQAEELERLKGDIRNKQAQEEERREISALKQQLATITQKLTETQQMNQQLSSVPGGFPSANIKKETINDRSVAGQPFNPFLSNNFPTQNNITGPQPGIFLDTYAKKQASPMKTNGGFSTLGGGSELDRLMKEREDLVRTGCYTQDDPLIQELDRQIRACQLRMMQ